MFERDVQLSVGREAMLFSGLEVEVRWELRYNAHMRVLCMEDMRLIPNS